MKTRIVLTVLLVLGYLVGMSLYDMMQGPIEAAAAVGQLSDGTVQYGTSRAVARGLIPQVARWLMVGLFGVIWLPSLLRAFRVNRSTTPLLVIATASIILAGCRGPYQVEIVEEIAPNETAFLVPLEGNTQEGQGRFMSIEYLDKAKVATKRVTIPTRRHNTGRGPGSYEWIPTVKLIKVDRTPGSRVFGRRAMLPVPIPRTRRFASSPRSPSTFVLVR